jgi:ATP-dependent HslUV protease ATP-binding subunit HslU
MTRAEKIDEIADKAELNVEERILDLLLPPPKSALSPGYFDFDDEEESANITPDESPAANAPRDENFQRTREKLRTQLRAGKLDNRIVELEVREKNFPTIELAGPQGIEEMGINMKDMLGNMFQGRTKRRKMRVDEAMEYLMQEEEERLIDMDTIARAALERVESAGIIFLDELDKIAGRESGGGPDVSREGVQRDILPIVEGTNVNTRYGMVKTDHILFIAAGAFHVSKPSDLIPELQGRFPIRVELEALTIDDFKRILTEPKNALIKQYQALLETEGIQLEFTPDAISAVAEFAAQVNEQTENIGARRLHTIMEKLLDEISFEGPDLEPKQQRIDAAYVNQMLAETVKDQDLSRYIL